jgi:hypothetical protein
MRCFSPEGLAKHDAEVLASRQGEADDRTDQEKWSGIPKGEKAPLGMILPEQPWPRIIVKKWPGEELEAPSATIPKVVNYAEAEALLSHYMGEPVVLSHYIRTPSETALEGGETMPIVTDEDVEAVELVIGMGHGAWDMVDPKQILTAARYYFLARAPRPEASAVDWCDLMVDEFTRISHLTDNEEIKGLCDRAITNTKQHFPVMQQRDNFYNRWLETEKKLTTMKEILEKRAANIDPAPDYPLTEAWLERDAARKEVAMLCLTLERIAAFGGTDAALPKELARQTLLDVDTLARQPKED